MSAQKLSARAVRRLVRIGQRWARRRDGAVVVIYQVHHADRSAEAYLEGEDPRAPRTRFQLGFGELGAKYRMREGDDAREAA
jgi:hypothetical protein